MLYVRPDGRLSQQPAPELTQLRGEHYALVNLDLANTSYVINDANGQGDTIEIIAEFAPGDALVYGLKVRRSADGQQSVPISFDGTNLNVAGQSTAVDLLDGEQTVSLHVFIDKNTVEVFANDWVVFIKNFSSSATDLGVELFATGGTATVQSLDIWQLDSIW